MTVDEDTIERDPAVDRAFINLTSAIQKADNDLARMHAVRDCAATLEPLGDPQAIDDLREMGHVAGIADETMGMIVQQGLDIAVNERASARESQANGHRKGNGAEQHRRGEHNGAAEVPIDLDAVFAFLGDEPASAPRELIKKQLPAFGVAVTGGQSSAGKTFIAIYKAVCLATTRPFFGRKIVERVGTAFVAAEGRAIIPNRFAAALAKESITEKLPITWLKQLPDFSSAAGIKLFVRQLQELNKRFQGDFGARLGHITIDTIAASFGMKDEDDNAEATKVCNVMLAIGNEIGALMNPVHHFGKNPESGLRGASAWKGSADMVEGVLADIDPLSGRTSNRELVCAKSRDGEQGPLSPFELEFITLGFDADHEPYGSCCVVPTQGASRFEKAAALSKSQRAAQDAISEALDSQGKIIVPRAGMPQVRAAKVSDIRVEFDRRYIVDQAEPLKAAEAKRKAFKRAIDHLSPTQFGAGSAEGADWIWRTQG